MRELLETHGAAERLVAFGQDSTFEIASEAFATLRELLLAQAPVTAAYFERKPCSFFDVYDTALKAGDYVTQRQAMHLLRCLLLHPRLEVAAAAYAGRLASLQVQLELLCSASRALRREAGQVLTLFVAAASSQEGPVRRALVRNRRRLAQLLGCVAEEPGTEAALATSLRCAVASLWELPEASARRLADAPPPSVQLPEAAAPAGEAGGLSALYDALPLSPLSGLVALGGATGAHVLWPLLLRFGIGMSPEAALCGFTGQGALGEGECPAR